MRLKPPPPPPRPESRCAECKKHIQLALGMERLPGVDWCWSCLADNDEHESEMRKESLEDRAAAGRELRGDELEAAKQLEADARGEIEG